jgi:hypothetical protein
MVEIPTENLAELQQQEAELIATLATVRLAIQAIVAMLPAGARGGTKQQPPESNDGVGRFMNQVLAELGVQFTSVDIFEKAKKMQPDFDRKLLEKAVNRLQRTGAIQKIEAGRGWRPARFQKRFQR